MVAVESSIAVVEEVVVVEVVEVVVVEVEVVVVEVAVGGVANGWSCERKRGVVAVRGRRGRSVPSLAGGRNIARESVARENGWVHSVHVGPWGPTECRRAWGVDPRRCDAVDAAGEKDFGFREYQGMVGCGGTAAEGLRLAIFQRLVKRAQSGKLRCRCCCCRLQA